jgi:hypothetical protein
MAASTSTGGVDRPFSYIDTDVMLRPSVAANWTWSRHGRAGSGAARQG